MKLINNTQENIIKLNIGGNYFTTSRATLCADKDSMLGVMFSGIHHVTKCDDGAYFIDADGTHFRYILNFLRGKIKDASQLPTDLLTLHQIKVEANYFQVKGLENMIDPLLQKNQELSGYCTDRGPPLQQDYISRFFSQATILSRPSQQTPLPYLLLSTYALRFDNLNLDGICFASTYFQNTVTFRNTSLVGANFRNCEFAIGGDFRDADLRRCDFRGSDIDRGIGKSNFLGCKHFDEAYFTNLARIKTSYRFI